VFAEVSQGRKALVRGPPKQFEMRPSQIAHGHLQVGEKEWEKPLKSLNCTTCLSGVERGAARFTHDQMVSNI
jgi:hypothetical protein